MLKTQKQLTADAYETMNVLRVPPLLVAKTLGLTETQLDTVLAKGGRRDALLVLATIKTITEAELKAEAAKQEHIKAFLDKRKTAIKTINGLLGLAQHVVTVSEKDEADG